MSQFKTKEEYEKWKAEKIKSNEDRAQKLKEEEKLKKLWVCPDCLSSNDNSQLKCSCGYTIDKIPLNFINGNLTASELYEIVLHEFFLLNDSRATYLSHYLIKRFPNAEEAIKIKERMDSYSETVICGKCGITNIYNPKYYQKDKCERCGDWLHQYLDKKETGEAVSDQNSKYAKSKSQNTEKTQATLKTFKTCPKCHSEYSAILEACPKCKEVTTGTREIKITLMTIIVFFLLIVGMCSKRDSAPPDYSPAGSYSPPESSYSSSEAERTRSNYEQDERRRKLDALQPSIKEMCRQGNDDACRQAKHWEDIR